MRDVARGPRWIAHLAAAAAAAEVTEILHLLSSPPLGELNSSPLPSPAPFCGGSRGSRTEAARKPGVVLSLSSLTSSCLLFAVLLFFLLLSGV